MKKIKYVFVCFKFCFQSKYNPVQNMFATVCCVTVSFIKIGPLKDILFWEESVTSLRVPNTFPFIQCYLLPEDGRKESPKHVMVEATKWTYCVQMLCLCGFKWLLKQYWTDCVTEFGLVHSEILSDLFEFRCEQSADFFVSLALYIAVPTRTFSWCLLPTVNPLCCPTHIFHTKLQANNSKPCAWFRPFSNE